MDIEWTNGMIMFISGIAGSCVCIVMFFVMAKVFRHKRKKLLNKIENEYE